MAAEAGCCVVCFVHEDRDADFHQFLYDSGSDDNNILKVSETLSITVEDKGLDPHNSEVKMYGFTVTDATVATWRDVSEVVRGWSPMYCPRFNADENQFEENRVDFESKKDTIPAWTETIYNTDPTV